ncbi:MAG: hypothetical protein OXN92_13585 [Gammaproteobacteria bacterium]|nr:hypothetical protein [Gammaproteobacteria bacterium]
MKYSNDKSVKRRVAEPVQVYLRPAERDRLERLTAKLETTKSDVLRRGLEALEGQLSDPERHPVLEIIGMVSTAHTPGVDVARAHDEYLAGTEAASWSRRQRVRGGQDSE